MSLLGIGSATRKRATDLFGAVADIEAREEQARLGLDAAKEAQQMQTYGTAAGIGSMWGLQKDFAGKKEVKDLITGLNETFSGSGSFSTSGGALNFTPTGGETVQNITGIGDVFAAAPEAEALLTAGETVAGGVGASGAGLAETTAVIDASVSTPVVLEAGGAVEAAAAATAQQGGALATLGSVAAPIGIALGVGFLLNKLFD